MREVTTGAVALIMVAGCVLDRDPGLREALPELASFRIESPPSGAVIASEEEPAEIAFVAIGTTTAGREIDVTDAVRWSVDAPQLASFDEEDPGVLRTNGFVGGPVEARATLPSAPGLATETRDVWLATRAVEDLGLDRAESVAIAREIEDSTTITAGDLLLHPRQPVDGEPPAVPTAFGGFEVAWSPGEPGDALYLCLRKGGDLQRTCAQIPTDDPGAPAVRVEAAFVDDGEGDEDERRVWTVRGPSLAMLAETLPEDPVVVESVRIRGERVELERRELSLIRTRGVQSWYLEATEDNARLLRANPEFDARDVILPAPFGSAGAGACQGCHLVTADSDRLVTAIGDYNEGLAFGARADPEALRSDPAVGFELWEGPSYFPTASRNQADLAFVQNAQLVYFDRFDSDGDEDLPIASEPREIELGRAVTMPALLGEEERVFVVVPESGDGSPVEIYFQRSDLRLVDLEEEALGEILISGEDLRDRPEGGAAISFPVLSPSGDGLVFVHGPQAGLRTPGGSPSEAALYWLDLATPETPVRLGRSLPGEPSASWPAFLPDGTDEHSDWLTFTSRAPFAGERNDQYQLWVTRIARSGASDRSSPPVHLPYQSDGANYLRAQFVGAPVGGCTSSLDCPPASICRPTLDEPLPVCVR